MAKYCDVISPMIYPSHFFGMDGYASPGDAPEHFIGESMERFQKVTAGSGVVLRPWLQAFGWKTKTYSPEYIRIQVAVSHSKGGDGFLFWNANNDYSKPYTAMPEMRQDKAKYFRGDEVKSYMEPPAPANGRANGRKLSRGEQSEARTQGVCTLTPAHIIVGSRCLATVIPSNTRWSPT